MFRLTFRVSLSVSRCDSKPEYGHSLHIKACHARGDAPKQLSSELPHPSPPPVAHSTVHISHSHSHISTSFAGRGRRPLVISSAHAALLHCARRLLAFFGGLELQPRRAGHQTKRLALWACCAHFHRGYPTREYWGGGGVPRNMLCVHSFFCNVELLLPHRYAR